MRTEFGIEARIILLEMEQRITDIDIKALNANIEDGLGTSRDQQQFRLKLILAEEKLIELNSAIAILKWVLEV
jgi:hypothetical protein